MNSIADRLTRAYCLFHWLQVRAIPEKLRNTLSYSALEHELLALKLKPEDFSAIQADSADTFEDSLLAFMVRYSGLTWSTCSLFVDAIEHPEWMQSGSPYLVTFVDDEQNPGTPESSHGLKRVHLSDFVFLKPSKVWMHQGTIRTLVVRWNPLEIKRLERFLRLASARHGLGVRVDCIASSDHFLRNIKATIGA